MFFLQFLLFTKITEGNEVSQWTWVDRQTFYKVKLKLKTSNGIWATKRTGAIWIFLRKKKDF